MRSLCYPDAKSNNKSFKIHINPLFSFMDTNIKASLKAVAASAVAMLIALQALPAGVLPPGYGLPQEPDPNMAGGMNSCPSCLDSGSAEVVALDQHGFARLNVDMNTFSPFPHSLLTIELGKPDAYMPSTYYMICLPGAKEGLSDSVLLRIGDKKISFEPDALDNGGKRTLRATNFGEYSLSREGDSIVVRNNKDTGELVFSTLDGGQSWRLASIRHSGRPGQAVTCLYSPDGLMTSVVNPDSSAYVVSYKNGLPIKIVDPSQAFTEISYDNRGHISGIRTSLPKGHPLHPGKSLKPGAQNKPFVVRDIHADMDANGRIVKLLNTWGELYEAEYQENETDGKLGGKRTSYMMGILKRPDGAREFLRISRNEDGTRIEVRGEVVVEGGSEIFKVLGETVLSMKANTLVPVKKISGGRTYEMRRESATAAITSEVDPLGQITRREYDGDNRLTAVIFPDKSSRRYEYDSSGRLVRELDETGRELLRRYNSKGLLESITENGLDTAYRYDSSGIPLETILPGNRVHRFKIDRMGRVVEHVPPDGRAVKYLYVKNMNLLSKVETFPSQDVSLPPEIAGRMTKEYAVSAKVFAYDPFARLIRIGYPDRTFECFKRTCCGISEFIDRKGVVTKYAFDKRHLKVSEKSLGKETLYVYDTMGRMAKRINSDKSFTEWKFCPVSGDLLEESNSDGTWVRYARDEAGRIVRKDFSDGTKSAYTLDARGRIVGIRGNHEENVDRVYDKGGALVLETNHGLPYGSKSETTEYKRDDFGRVAQVIKNGGVVISHFYKSDTGDLIATCGNGLVKRWKFDNAGRLIATAEIPEDALRRCGTSEERDALFEKNVVERRAYEADGKMWRIPVRKAENKELAGSAVNNIPGKPQAGEKQEATSEGAAPRTH